MLDRDIAAQSSARVRPCGLCSVCPDTLPAVLVLVYLCLFVCVSVIVCLSRLSVCLSVRLFLPHAHAHVHAHVRVSGMCLLFVCGLSWCAVCLGTSRASTRGRGPTFQLAPSSPILILVFLVCEKSHL